MNVHVIHSPFSGPAETDELALCDTGALAARVNGKYRDTVTGLLEDAHLLSGKRAGWPLLLLPRTSLMHLEFERHVCKDRS